MLLDEALHDKFRNKPPFSKTVRNFGTDQKVHFLLFKELSTKFGFSQVETLTAYKGVFTLELNVYVRSTHGKMNGFGYFNMKSIVSQF